MVKTTDTQTDEHPHVDQLIGENDAVEEVVNATPGAEYEGFSDTHGVHVLTIEPKTVYETQRSLTQSGICPESAQSNNTTPPDVDIDNGENWVYTIQSD